MKRRNHRGSAADNPAIRTPQVQALHTGTETRKPTAHIQSYTIGSRSLTKADLSEIGERIKYWTNEVSRLENIEARGGRNRVFRVVPRDL